MREDSERAAGRQIATKPSERRGQTVAVEQTTATTRKVPVAIFPKPALRPELLLPWLSTAQRRLEKENEERLRAEPGVLGLLEFILLCFSSFLTLR